MVLAKHKNTKYDLDKLAFGFHNTSLYSLEIWKNFHQEIIKLIEEKFKSNLNCFKHSQLLSILVQYYLYHIVLHALFRY